MLSWLIFN